ncbi:MAG: OsmC family protein [Gammaproteobacteria bacterium]|nr:OsmC family protein [Gammaproteobacteria bacterium]
MAIKMKPYVRQVVTGTAESHSVTVLKTRDLMDVSDEPVERGGTNEGMSPTELFESSLIACTNVISHKVAKKNGVNLMSMEITLDAGFNRHGVMLKEEVDLPFEDMKLMIEVTTDASDEEMDILAKELAMYCPISKMIVAAGTKLETQWIINRP